MNTPIPCMTSSTVSQNGSIVLPSVRHMGNATAAKAACK